MANFSPPKYEPLASEARHHHPRTAEEEEEEEDEEVLQDSLFAGLENDYRSLRLKIIGLGLCFGSLVAVLLILVTFGVTLHGIVSRMQPPAGESCSSSSSSSSSSTSSPPAGDNTAHNHQPSTLQKPGSFVCGATAAEARALGCQWDIMTMSWEHPDCFDADLTREFEEAGPWQFYHSSRPGKQTPEPEMLTPIPPEAVSESTERMWTDRRYHILHCIYAWKMMHRAVERGWKIQGELASYHHTEHCSKALADTSIPLDHIVTKVNVQFPTC